MTDKEMADEAKRRGISVAQLKMLLGDGAATRVALTIKDRKAQLDKAISDAGG